MAGEDADSTAERVGVDVVDGLDEAQNMGYLESAKVSLSNYRRMAGMTVGVAVAVDLLFIGLGASAAAQTSGILRVLALALVGIGAIGLLEKTLRRLL